MNYYLLKEYIRYWLHCLDEHSLHSPFVYDLYTQVIQPSGSVNIFPEIEELRKQLESDNSIINTQNFGARSTVEAAVKRQVKSIAKYGISGRKNSQLYYNLGCHFELENIWELGTSLGISTLYLASVPNSRVTTFEGNKEILAIARKNFRDFGKTNITVIEGNLDEILTSELGKVSKLDLVFFDANHRYEPTIRYFEACLKKTHSSSLFIFDDIHWSKEMNQAWKAIIDHPLAGITLDLFQTGLVFFDPELPKQHFILNF